MRRARYRRGCIDTVGCEQVREAGPLFFAQRRRGRHNAGDVLGDIRGERWLIGHAVINDDLARVGTFLCFGSLEDLGHGRRGVDLAIR